MKTFPRFIYHILFIAFIILYSSCEKEYSYEAGPLNGTGGIAIYSLEGAGGICTGAIVNGTYTTATALQSSNNIELQVNVTTIGTYTISTLPVNGIQFSASGSFSVTGLQTITLTGSGTPLAAGIFTFTASAGSGCSFVVTVATAPLQTAIYTLEGEPGTCSNFKVNGMYIAGDALTSDNTVEVMVNVTAIGSYTINTDTIDGISFMSSGNFTTTGIQNVILRGFGTPLTSNFFTFTPGTGTSGCTFSLTVITPAPPATYVLESNYDHACSGYSVSGTCYAGMPLLSTNTMAVKVFVTDLGNFAISTNTVNGMIFSYMGTFLTPGSQMVVLTGSGTPVSPGTYAFTPQIIGPHPIGGESCTTEINVQ